MKKILVSACLLGEKCRYDGESKPMKFIDKLGEFYDIVPFCPEVEGGLPTPRPRSERKGNRVKTEDGKDVTEEYRLGAEKCLRLCKFLSIRTVVLKENSPSCGSHEIHNGRFDGKLIPGKGVTAELLERNGIEVLNESEASSLADSLYEKRRVKELAKKAKEEEEKVALAKKKKEERAKRFSSKPRKSFGKKPFGKPSRFKKDDRKGR